MADDQASFSDFQAKITDDLGSISRLFHMRNSLPSLCMRACLTMEATTGGPSSFPVEEGGGRRARTPLALPQPSLLFLSPPLPSHLLRLSLDQCPTTATTTSGSNPPSSSRIRLTRTATATLKATSRRPRQRLLPPMLLLLPPSPSGFSEVSLDSATSRFSTTGGGECGRSTRALQSREWEEEISVRARAWTS